MSDLSQILKLHGMSTSTCTQRVKVVAYEKELDVDVELVNLAKQEQKSPAYLEKQPFGQVPYLDDDGYIIYESRAIARYIALKYANQGTKLIPEPTDLKAYGIFEQAASVEQSNFDPAASGIVAQKRFIPAKGGKTDEAQVERHAQTLQGKLDGYERILKKQRFIAGNDISAVDLFHLPYGTMLENVLPGTLTNPERPGVARWWQEITSRPSWKRVLLEAS